MGKPIIVIGAGIVGVSTALWLRRSGQEVLLLDKTTPGSGASFGNAGLLAQWAIAPVTSPGMWRDLPRYVLDPKSPLFIQWAAFPKLVPWLLKLLSNATDTKTRTIAGNLAPLLTDAVDQHKSLVKGTPAEAWVRDSKFSYAYASRAKFEADAYSWALKREVGFVPTVLEGGAVQEEEPILGPAVGCLAVLEGHGHVTDPAGYVAAIARQFEAEGGRFVQAEVRDILKDGDKVTGVATDMGQFDCERLVVTAGIWSRDLLRKIGLDVPLRTERGYHVVFENPSELPRNPMMISDGKFGVNPMEMGLRCAGTVEIGDHHAGPSKAPVALIRHHVKRVFPNLTYSGTTEWLGFRPTVPDSTPLIGEIGQTGIWAGFGHQHVGLTAGPKTGRLLAQMMTGNTPNLDMTPYQPMRFRAR